MIDRTAAAVAAAAAAAEWAGLTAWRGRPSDLDPGTECDMFALADRLVTDSHGPTKNRSSTYNLV